MRELLSSLTRGRRVLIIGFGREGQATYRLLTEKREYRSLAVADIKPAQGVEDAEILSGEGYLDRIDEFDIAFKSPGVVLPRPRDEYSCYITSQTELFLRLYNRQVIGITGTKGKSTVSKLMYHILSSNGVPCLLAGNIGIPVFEIADKLSPHTVAVVELSCHQLEYCAYSPAVSVLLNIYEDHLDHYGTAEKYARAKKNIYLNQHPLDVLYCDKSVEPTGAERVSRTVTVRRSDLPFPSFDELDGVKLRGEHNLKNCAFVYDVAKTFGITDGQFMSSLISFEPLRHRLELIGNVDGVDYFDDSISTTAESAISAVESIKNASTLLLGGMDRGIEYGKLINFVAGSRLQDVICMYKSGKRIFDLLSQRRDVLPRLHYCEDLNSAVALARRLTPPGKACILSPASASYGYFKNFEERGDRFRELVFADT